MLHAGDFTAHGVLEDLRRLGPVAGVRGNMDDDRLRALLRERRTVEVAGLRLGMVHDAGPRVGRERRLAAAFPGCEAVVYGHTHEPQVERIEGVWILNPGSPTERRRAPTRSFLVVDVVDGLFEPRLVELA